MTPLHRLIAAITILLFALCASTFAAMPITVQGSIKNSGGVPVSGTHSMTFRIYDSASGGSQLWTETHATVSFTNGIYSAVLGNSTALDGVFGAGLQRWLSVSLDAGTEFTPRQQISASAYAIYAEISADASTLDGATSTSFALASHTHPVKAVFCGNSGGNVGIGPTYIPVGGASILSTEVNAQALMPADLTLQKLAVKLTAAPGVGSTRTVTVRVNGISTLLSTTLTGFGNYVTISAPVQVLEGDLISVQASSSGAPASSGIQYSIYCE